MEQTSESEADSSSSGSDDDEEESPQDVLFELIRRNSISQIRELVQSEELNIDLPDENGETAVYHAIESSSTAALRELVALGADLNIVHEERNLEPALFTAIQLNRVGIMKELIDLGADPERRSYDEHPILVEIIRLNRMDCLEALLEIWNMRGANNLPTFDLFVEEALFKCVEENNLNVLRRLLDVFALKVDLECQDENDDSLIELSIEHNLPEILRELIQHGADINRQDGSEGHTPLMLAVMLNRTVCIDVLLECGSTNDSRWKVMSKECKIFLPPTLIKLVCDFAGFLRINTTLRNQIGETIFEMNLPHEYSTIIKMCCRTYGT